RRAAAARTAVARLVQHGDLAEAPRATAGGRASLPVRGLPAARPADASGGLGRRPRRGSPGPLGEGRRPGAPHGAVRALPRPQDGPDGPRARGGGRGVRRGEGGLDLWALATRRPTPPLSGGGRGIGETFLWC